MFTPIKRVFAPFSRILTRVFPSCSHNMVTSRLVRQVTCTCTCVPPPLHSSPILKSHCDIDFLQSFMLFSSSLSQTISELTPAVSSLAASTTISTFRYFFMPPLGLCSCPDCRAWRPSLLPRNVGLLRSRLRGGTESQRRRWREGGQPDSPFTDGIPSLVLVLCLQLQKHITHTNEGLLFFAARPHYIIFMDISCIVFSPGTQNIM